MENFKHVFIFNIPEDVLKEELLEILERFGPVTSISIQKLDQETQVKYAIVEFQSHLIAFNAIRNLTGYIIKNHALNLYFFDIIEMKPVNIPPNYSPQSTQDNEIEQNKQNKQNEQNEQNKQNQLEK
ncbi:RNA-binding protein [Anaeramoeba ignava]|uniref:RNA-binding protein n=1 Tax=Anaeramoeba ignava TaxID=1746090 RepID=A0A9Q0RFT7_ANAIG|nr:RNA-binding protein [Anaeramoeba ignava]